VAGSFDVVGANAAIVAEASCCSARRERGLPSRG
jgi:hypothetical protein